MLKTIAISLCVLFTVLCGCADPGSRAAFAPTAIQADELGKTVQLMGKLREPLGACITVQGVVVEGPYKGFEGGPNIRPQRIQGRAIQEDVLIPIRPYFGNWGDRGSPGETTLPKLVMGGTYEMEGYTTGEFVGIPSEAYKRAGFMLQTTGYYFHQTFVVYRARLIEPIK